MYRFQNSENAVRLNTPRYPQLQETSLNHWLINQCCKYLAEVAKGTNSYLISLISLTNKRQTDFQVISRSFCSKRSSHWGHYNIIRKYTFTTMMSLCLWFCDTTVLCFFQPELIKGHANESCHKSSRNLSSTDQHNNFNPNYQEFYVPLSGLCQSLPRSATCFPLEDCSEFKIGSTFRPAD